MQNVGATWLMTSLAPTPFMVSLVQAANFLPIFFFAIPAGTLADLFDRRKLLIFTQCWMMVAAALLGIFELAGGVSAWTLLFFTFMLGLGYALNAPAWQAIVPEMVPADELAPAVALGSTSFNIARAIGPALGGVAVAYAGAGFNFLLNAVSFLAVIIVLYRWRREVPEKTQPIGKFTAAMLSGVRYVWQAPAIHRILVRTLVFMVPASALWALLPVIAHDELKSGPGIYGVLLGCLGAGAVVGTFILSGMRRRFTSRQVLGFMSALFGIVTIVTAFERGLVLLCIGLLLGGVAWLSVLSILNTAVQVAVPSWVRARALSIYLLVFFGGLSGGSALWGVVAGRVGTPEALYIAGASLVAGLVFDVFG